MCTLQEIKQRKDMEMLQKAGEIFIIYLIVFLSLPVTSAPANSSGEF